MLEAILVGRAGFAGGFVSTLASNGSSITLPPLEPFGLSEHAANGTNRFSVVALGIWSAVFCREGLIDWRQGARITAFVALGTLVGSRLAAEPSDTPLDLVVGLGLAVVLVLLFVRPNRWLSGAPPARTWRRGSPQRTARGCGSTASRCASWSSTSFTG